MVAISQTTFSSACPWMKTLEILIEFYCYALECNYEYGSIGSDNGLTPKWQQAIIWTNYGLDHWPPFASLGFDELKTSF